jgi:hypothetical protein
MLCSLAYSIEKALFIKFLFYNLKDVCKIIYFVIVYKTDSNFLYCILCSSGSIPSSYTFIGTELS